MIVYATGYTGRKHGELILLLHDLDAALIDVRLSPRSRRPIWSQEAFEACHGCLYHHEPAWGNLNYRTGGEIKIADFDAGVQRIPLMTTWAPNLLLLCACKGADGCHRTVLREKLAALGYETLEVDR